MRSRAGSATIEAALIYPLLVLLLVYMMNRALMLHEVVERVSSIHVEEGRVFSNEQGCTLCLAKWHTRAFRE